MNIDNLTKPVSSAQLNETMFKKFGVRVDFNRYTREELENYRNLLRTKVAQLETKSSFNELLTDESYQKDKYIMGMLNQKIKEIVGESKMLSEKSTSEKQARTMAAAAHNPKFAKKVGIKQSVAKEFNKKDKGTKLLSKAMKHKKNTSEGSTNMKTTTNESTAHLAKAAHKHAKMYHECWSAGNLEEAMYHKKQCEECGGMIAHGPMGECFHTHMKLNKGNPYRVDEGASLGGTVGAAMESKQPKKAKKDYDGDGKIESPKDEVWGSRAKAAAKAGKPFEENMKTGDTTKSSTGGTITKTKTGLKHTSGKNYSAMNPPPEDTKKKKAKESKFRQNANIINEGLRRLILEDEEGKAKSITAGTDMVNDFTSWMQRVGQYQTKSMIELADAIKANFGQQESEQFKSSVQPALDAALQALTQAREEISNSVAVLAGEQPPSNPMGMEEPGMKEPGMEPPMDDMAGGEDEFGASDAAAGGMETAGRARRESREIFARKLAESHNIMRSLSK